MEKMLERFVRWIIARYLPGHSLHHNPVPGLKRRSRGPVTDTVQGVEAADTGN
jgi:hypothetical protein